MNEHTFSLKQRRVVVIGASSGIGFAVAVLAWELGAEVVIASSNAEHINSAVGRLQGATGAVVDLRNETSVSHFFGKLGAFDHLAVTAGDWGATMFAPARDIDIAAARDGFEVRFWGVLGAVKHGCQQIADDGSITLTSGMLAHRPRKAMPLAAAMGGAVEYLTRGLAVDLAPVRVNAVCPGLVLTEHVMRMPAEMRQSSVAGLPLPRCASPEEAAKAYVYAMVNGYVTGQILPVDGGGGLV